MIEEKALLEFVEPYYVDKDIMHNMWHIELVKKMVNKILSIGGYKVEEECLMLATYFHGFIYKDEEKITQWMKKTLITGSVRGQSLLDTLDFMKNHVLNKNACYLPETIPLCKEMNAYANRFFEDLVEGIQDET